MILSGWRFLNSVRINQLVNVLISTVEVAQPLIFLQRTPVVFAEDDEIVAQFNGHTYAADIITDDAQAVVVDGGVFKTFMNSIPNIKIGARVGQSTMQRLRRLKSGNVDRAVANADIIRNWEKNLALNLVTGVRQRMNAICCAMYCDDMQYDRLGVKINGTWGMPSTLKPVVSPWNGPNATPVTDVLTLVEQTAPDVHGETFDRATMSKIAFRWMAASTEFKNLVAGRMLLPGSPATQINYLQLEDMRRFAVDILGLEIELYDGIYYTRDSSGVHTRSRYLPTGKVIFSTKANDGDRSVMDFASGIVSESIAASLINGPEGIAGEQQGPISYYTGSLDLNPPSVTAWAVVRGFARKHRNTATACMTVFPPYPTASPAYYP